MKDIAFAQFSLSRLSHLTLVLRGLLAESTGNPDAPYAPVTLRTITTKRAIDFAKSPENADTEKCPAPLKKPKTPPLLLDPAKLSDEPDDLREQLKGVIDNYTEENRTKPQMICIPGCGIVYVDSADDSDLPLKNKIAIVTGAAGAIGYGICKALLENGCHLAATDLAGEKLDKLTCDLKETWSDRVIGLALDVTDKDSVSKALQIVIQEFGGIDILIANAGIPMVAQLKDIDLETFRKLEKVNVEGTLLTLSAAAHCFITQATGGDIVVMSTKNVPSPGAGFGGYSATKAACHQLGRIASIELAQYGIRVNMVAPDAVFEEGKFKSGLWQEIGPDRMKARGLDEKQLQDFYKNRNLLKIQVTGRHVANAVLFFVTHQTPTTGATIPVDGGLPDATPR